MYAAIRTKFAGPTNRTGARIIVTAGDFRTVVPYEHAYAEPRNHLLAALAFARSKDWDGTWYGGHNGNGYVFVRTVEALDPREHSFVVGDQ